MFRKVVNLGRRNTYTCPDQLYPRLEAHVHRNTFVKGWYIVNTQLHSGVWIPFRISGILIDDSTHYAENLEFSDSLYCKFCWFASSFSWSSPTRPFWRKTIYRAGLPWSISKASVNTCVTRSTRSAALKRMQLIVRYSDKKNHNWVCFLALRSNSTLR